MPLVPTDGNWTRKIVVHRVIPVVLHQTPNGGVVRDAILDVVISIKTLFTEVRPVIDVARTGLTSEEVTQEGGVLDWVCVARYGG